jgi:hypothetical protein
VSAADRLADLRRWVDATGADEDVRERAVAMLAGVLPTPEECERLEAAGWAPSRLGARWWTRALELIARDGAP